MFDLIKRNLLKSVLFADGIVSVTAGVAFLGFSGLIAKLIGPAFTADAILGLGAFLVLWGLYHLVLGGQASIGGVRIAIAGDALWVLGSIAVLVADWDGLTSLGAAFITLTAVAVADIMLLKMKGLSDRRRLAAA
ncbi:hypothetical protein CXZ10_10720 [Pleomorphomonas diazotrophica]|uniref:Uncharacterized protein n=1 Tax=Pleomorphomonas diazotrophica TaxID=1166257 RepID=A0A1I4UJ15_9HYPH|nr:hypothetical protein [Pleomorphomonas diazotrophica]PKR89152.1 hypothetical protein CXZ10_10720 [Pleomorphomonas diazotrophica]SFM88948.1 hypothetical protein SAMN05192571_10887 [Pleomorphomonas diazotrophica]